MPSWRTSFPMTRQILADVAPVTVPRAAGRLKRLMRATGCPELRSNREQDVVCCELSEGGRGLGTDREQPAAAAVAALVRHEPPRPSSGIVPVGGTRQLAALL